MLKTRLKTRLGNNQMFIRSEVVQFSPILMEGNNRMFIKYPERESSCTTYIQPFDPTLWLAPFILLLLLASVLSVTYHLGQEKIVNKGSFTFSNSLLTVFGAQMGIGSSTEPKTLTTKAVFLLVFLLSIFVLTCYSAKMISFLSVFKYNHNFHKAST